MLLITWVGVRDGRRQQRSETRNRTWTLLNTRLLGLKEDHGTLSSAREQAGKENSTSLKKKS